MSLLALAGALALAAEPQRDLSNDPDVRCFLAAAVAGGTVQESGDAQARAGITTVLMYFFGKVEGRLHGTDFKSEMGRLIHSPEFARALPAEMARCGQEAQERGRALQDLGEYLKGLVPPGN